MIFKKRKQIRLKNYDYSQNGYYFVTVCTHNKQPILSEVRRGGVLLRPFGEIVKSEIENLRERYKIEIDPYVIMPDHIHMIIRINRDMRAEQSPAPTPETKKLPSIGDVLCAFKSLTTKMFNKRYSCVGRKLWQRNYYEHVIRDENDYNEKAQYILNNPLKWELDKSDNL